MFVNIVGTLEADLVLPPELQYSTKTTEVEVVESTCLLHIYRPGLCYIQQRRKDDGLAHLQLHGELEDVTIPNCTLKTTRGLNGLGNPADHFVVDFGAVGKGAAQIPEVIHPLQLDSVHANLRRIVGIDGWRLMHDHRLHRVDDQAEVVAGVGKEEIYAPLHVLL
ncbi:hypothetical protein SprV_1002913200 [Sparganum proliferum]